MRSDEVKKEFIGIGLTPILDSTQDSFNAHITGEIERWKTQSRAGEIAVLTM